MATNKDLDSEVIFKEKVEEKEIKGERATEDNRIRSDSRASTPAASPLDRRWERTPKGTGEEVQSPAREIRGEGRL